MHGTPKNTKASGRHGELFVTHTIDQSTFLYYIISANQNKTLKRKTEKQILTKAPEMFPPSQRKKHDLRSTKTSFSSLRVAKTKTLSNTQCGETASCAVLTTLETIQLGRGGTRGIYWPSHTTSKYSSPTWEMMHVRSIITLFLKTKGREQHKWASKERC